MHLHWNFPGMSVFSNEERIAGIYNTGEVCVKDLSLEKYPDPSSTLIPVYKKYLYLSAQKDKG